MIIVIFAIKLPVAPTQRAREELNTVVRRGPGLVSMMRTARRRFAYNWKKMK